MTATADEDRTALIRRMVEESTAASGVTERVTDPIAARKVAALIAARSMVAA